MSELVQRHMESMADEIEEMRRTKLYTPEETRLILKTRKEFEYKINGVSKKLQDFKQYIIYEKVLLKQIQKRRDKHRIADRKSGIEYKILRRIKNLYEIALQRFSSDFSLCLEYFKFCKQSNYVSAASATVQNMLKNCCQNPEVWLVAANWYAHERNDIGGALKVLHKGLTLHKKSQLLFTEAINLELSVVKEEGEASEEENLVKEKVCQKIETYIKLIGESIQDSSYLVEILHLLEKYSFTTPVQNVILGKLLESYSDREFVWHTLAERERRGLHYSPTNEQSPESPVSLCIAKYQEGLTKVSASEKASLWSKYLDCLIEVRRENTDLSDAVKNNLLKTALQQASNERFLTEKYYLVWLELGSDDEALDILEKGTKALPQSPDLWKLRLRYATMTDKKTRVDEVFEEGIAELKENSLPLWLMYLRYFNLLSRDDLIDSIYRRGIEQPEEISQVLKPKYVEWLALIKGINDARKMYNILAHQKPFCKELHSTMSKLESTEIEYDFEVWAGVHELACRQFGEEDVDVWINHILFYLHFNKTDNVNDNVQRIYREAENALPPLLQSDFREKYTNALAITDSASGYS